jgi:hypothetical protein
MYWLVLKDNKLRRLIEIRSDRFNDLCGLHQISESARTRHE